MNPKTALCVFLGLCGCASAPPLNPAGATAAQANVNVRVRVRLNCASMCDHIEMSCRQACRPQAWSPNMQSMQDSCEHDCDFQRFSCVHDCEGA